MLLLAHSDDTAIWQRLAPYLEEVEARFSAELISDLPCVNQLVAHVERYRGKMLRPTLVLVAGLAGAPKRMRLTDEHLVVATVVEMVHMATLVHDDILDEAQIRRGGETINHLRGNEAAVMLGDYLISHAYHLCSKLGSTLPSRIIADTTNTVCEGELLQLSHRGDVALDERTYFEMIRRKTGSLCGACCRLGALLSGVSQPVADRLAEYGEKLGVAFQIVDDQLDLVGSADTLGKPLGKDLQKGKLTLPLIHFFRSAPPHDRAQMRALLRATTHQEDTAVVGIPGRGAPTPWADQMKQVCDLIVASGSAQYTSQWASRLVEQAKATLDAIQESPVRSLLEVMADTVLTRKF